VKLFRGRRPSEPESAQQQVADELENLTDDDRELLSWGLQHTTGARMCGGAPTVSTYPSILRQVRNAEERR